MKAPHPPLGHPLPEHGERARGEGVGATQGLRPGLSSVAVLRLGYCKLDRIVPPLNPNS